MKATEIKLKAEGFNMSANTYAGKSHYKLTMKIGRVFPSTPAQAKFFIKEQVSLSVLNADDVQKVEALLNKYGFEGEYKSTKSKTWVRLQNNEDLYKALKSEYLS